jgi:hypothetical protein
MVFVPFGMTTSAVGLDMLLGKTLFPSDGAAAQSQYGWRQDNAAWAYRLRVSPGGNSLTAALMCVCKVCCDNRKHTI